MAPHPQTLRAWLVLNLAFGVHAYEEAVTGFLPIYNQPPQKYAPKSPGSRFQCLAVGNGLVASGWGWPSCWRSLQKCIGEHAGQSL
jgi:hypothetical protein